MNGMTTLSWLGTMRGHMSYISQAKKRDNMMCTFFGYQRNCVQGHPIDIVCENWKCNGQGTCVHSLGSQWHDHQIYSMCVWRSLCFRCFKFSWRLVVQEHPNKASCLQHMGVFWHNMTFVNFLMNSLLK